MVQSLILLTISWRVAKPNLIPKTSPSKKLVEAISSICFRICEANIVYGSRCQKVNKMRSLVDSKQDNNKNKIERKKE